MKKHTLIFSLSFILLIAFGLFYNHLLDAEEERLKSQKYLELFLDVQVDRLEEKLDVEFLAEGDTKIIRRLDAYQDDEVVGIIYVGKTKGRNEGLEVAFAINTNKDEIEGMLIVNSNETPQYQAILTDNDDFLEQFLGKDLSAKKFTVEATSGATLTGNGINKIMQLVRAQYDQDTDFETPAGITYVSSKQDFSTLNFIYEFSVGEENITVITDQDYQIISISNEDYREDAEVEIEAHPMFAFIRTIEENTITILSKGYGGFFISTATVEDGKITSFSSDLSNESYSNSYNEGYTGGDFNEMFEDVVSGKDLEAITGATVTSQGVMGARDILYSYLEAVNTNE